jgi:hypothetical protein
LLANNHKIGQRVRTGIRDLATAYDMPAQFQGDEGKDHHGGCSRRRRRKLRSKSSLRKRNIRKSRRSNRRRR